ncbi:MAG TPA: glycosyl transferase family 2, partial [Bacteroidia bacterium]|nr:glycosyl transferase family 2 [Bacteroidia bacterium]
MKNPFGNSFSDQWLRRVFFACAAVMLLIMLSVSGRYGVCWDEKTQKDYGDSVLNFYTSFGKDTGYINRQNHIHTYGGFVEVVCSVATKISSADPYDTRHFIIAWFGFFAMLFAGLVAKEIAGWKAGIVSLLFVFLTPVFFGHSMFNSKDIPFAACYTAGIYFLIRFLKELPSPSRKSVIYL